MNGLPPPGAPLPPQLQPQGNPLPNAAMQELPPGMEPPIPPEIFDLTLGKYDLIVQAGPSYTTRREELAATLTEAIRSFPQGASALLPVLVDTMDVPGADKVKARLDQIAQQSANGPEQQKQAAEMQKMQADCLQLKNENALLKAQAAADKQMATMQQQIADGRAALEKMQGEAATAMEGAQRSLDQQKLDIERMNADTNRIKADTALIAAKTVAAPLGVSETSAPPDIAKLISTAIAEAMSLMPAPVVQMPPAQRMQRTAVYDEKTGRIAHSIDEPIPEHGGMVN